MSTSPISSVNRPTSSHTHGVGVGTEISKEKKPTVLESHGYYLGNTIGSGSYATVRVAHSERHDGNVAIKIVSKFSAPADYLKKFLPREIEVVKGLKHPNLIRFLQAIETTHRVYIVMEYAENGSLLEIIRKDNYIDETRSRKWFRQLVDAVEYCHDRGVVHRDIKCENMLMDSEFNIKLSDFGFAKGHMKPKNGQLPFSETFCGSYAYASPEILKGMPYQPQQSDVWSMGIVLYAMVFGRLPFDDTNYSILLKQVSNKVTFPRDPKVTTACKALINKILLPVKARIKISGIRNDPWFSFTPTDKAGSSREQPSQESEQPTHVLNARGSQDEEYGPPTILTKQQLKSEAKPKDKSRRASTDDETAVGVQLPEDATTTDSESPYAISPKINTKKYTKTKD